MTRPAKHKRGDVISVDYAAPDRTAAADAAPGDRRVALRLAGHPYTYTVQVVTDSTVGPRLAALTIAADDGHAVDYDALRSVPARRLAYSAQQWIQRGGGRFAFPGDYAETHSRPELADPRLGELQWRIEQAIMNGEPVRRTVAADLNVSTATLDRLIAKARAEGLLTIAIPRRPSPKQRDALLARTLAENWLTEHGPDAEVPPPLIARLRVLRRDTGGTATGRERPR